MISVILSTNNEIRNGYLESIFEAIASQKTSYEIIVIDNESSDDTVKFCKKYTKNIYNLPGSNRAQRFNYGMEKAKGNIVLFHHAVTILPKGSFEYIEKYIEEGGIWGGHLHSFDTKHWLLNFTSWYSNYIRGKRGILYSDHLIFGTKDACISVGGFPNKDVVEETPFCLAMVKKYGKPNIIPYTSITSARRFVGRGIYKHALLNQYIKIGYYLGISDKIMNKQYEKKDGFNVKYK